MITPSIPPPKARLSFTECLRSRMKPNPKSDRTIAPDHIITTGFAAISFNFSKKFTEISINGNVKIIIICPALLTNPLLRPPFRRAIQIG